MRIGVLTTFDEINHGAYLQAYALQKVLQKLGYENSLINYKNLRYLVAEYRCYLNHKNPLNLIMSIMKIYKFRRDHKLLVSTKRVSHVESINEMKFDVIILGSDEIWNFNNCIGVDNDVFYSNGLDAPIVISYAVSMGSVSMDNVLPDHVIKGVRNIDHISVRDENTKEIVEAKIGKNAVLVLDPTFLYEFNDEIEPVKMDNYILIYGNISEPVAKGVRRYGMMKKMKIISIGYRQKWCDKNFIAVSPREWLGYMKNADYVVTSMYHGTIFAIKYKKKLAVVMTEYRRNKLKTIMNITGMHDICVASEDDVMKVLDREYDYNAVNDRIDVFKNRSFEYIRECL